MKVDSFFVTLRHILQARMTVTWTLTSCQTSGPGSGSWPTCTARTPATRRKITTIFQRRNRGVENGFYRGSTPIRSRVTRIITRTNQLRWRDDSAAVKTEQGVVEQRHYNPWRFVSLIAMRLWSNSARFDSLPRTHEDVLSICIERPTGRTIFVLTWPVRMILTNVFLPGLYF